MGLPGGMGLRRQADPVFEPTHVCLQLWRRQHLKIKLVCACSMAVGTAAIDDSACPEHMSGCYASNLIRPELVLQDAKPFDGDALADWLLTSDSS